MFTGIITDIGRITGVEHRGDRRLKIGTAYDTASIDMGASIACSGVCLTVVDKGPDWFAVEVSAETLSRTAGDWAEGTPLNLERALRVGDELGGHIVTGHVDGVGTVTEVTPEGDSTRVVIEAPAGVTANASANASPNFIISAPPACHAPLASRRGFAVVKSPVLRRHGLCHPVPTGHGR